jgi:quercetin dioxygenase-like cupin family protein
MSMLDAAPTAIHRSEADLPFVDLGDGNHLQLLQVDLANGVWVVRNRFEPGTTLQIHKHTGHVYAFTISGSWHYLESPEALNTAGSYLYEPAGSVHTFVCPESNTEDTVIFIRVEGANINFTEDGQFHSILDAVTIRHLVSVTADAQHAGPVDYIGGGAAGFMAKEA